MSLIVALETTLTVAPASAAVACLVQARPRVADPSPPRNNVQPAGVPNVPVKEFVVMNNTIVSPACTPPGNTTVWFTRLPALLADPTNDNTGSAAFATGTGPNPNAPRAVANTMTSVATSRRGAGADTRGADMVGVPPVT